MKLLIKKILSYLIDYGLIILFLELYFFCINVFMLDEKTYHQAYIMLACAFVTVFILTSYIPTSTKGQTIGQKIMKIRVVNKNGKARSYWQSFLRECLIKITCGPLFIIFTGLYFVVDMFVNRNLDVQLPHDMILKTKVEMIKT